MHVSGFTPLAAGMYKAWEVLKESTRRDPSTVPAMVVITDGSANVPLKRNLETGVVREIDEVRVAVREYEDLAVNDVFSVAKMIRREQINVVVINTNPHMYGRETYGFEVTERVARITGGTHHAIGRMTTENEMVEGIIEGIREDEKTIFEERKAG
jgi:Mg-chelatase subunit ChlD